MGDPKKPKKKYVKPRIGWQSELIDEQRKILDEYGLKNKKEFLRVETLLKNFRDQAKKLIADKSEQGVMESEQLLKKLIKLNLLKAGSKLDDILVLSVIDILERRLQTLIFRKNFAKTIKQARQFIVHGHVAIGENKINVPSYLISSDEEGKINFSSTSNMANEDHPERVKEASKKEEVKKEEVDVEDIFEKEKRDKQPSLKKNVDEEKKKVVIKEKQPSPKEKVEEPVVPVERVEIKEK